MNGLAPESLALQLFIILKWNAFDVRGMEEKLSCVLFIYAFITIEAIFVPKISAEQSVLQAQITSMAYMPGLSRLLSATQSRARKGRKREPKKKSEGKL